MLKGTPPALARVAFFLAVLAVLVAANRGQFAATLYETQDIAANSLRVQEAKALTLLTGNYSRVGFYHPGPAILAVLAAGEVAFHDLLGWVSSPVIGQAIAGGIYTASWAVLIFVILARIAGSTVAGLAATGVMLAIAGLVDREYLQSIWFPYLYFMPFTTWCVALARIAQGRADALWVGALAAGFLVHGHASFIAFVALMSAGVAAWLLWRLRSSTPRGARFAACRAAARAHRGVLIAVAAIGAIFLAPLVLDLVLHFPGEFPRYLSYGRNAPSHGLRDGAAFVASFWGGAFAMAVGTALMVAAAWRSATAAARPVALVVALATLGLLLYARGGIDHLVMRYTAFFYLGAVALGVASLVLEAAARMPPEAGRVTLALVATASLCAAAWRVPPTAISHSAAVPAVAEAIRAAPSKPVVLDLDSEGYGVVWELVVGVAAFTDRTGPRLLCVDANWNVLFTFRYRCSAAETARGTRMQVSARPLPRQPGEPGGTWEGAHFALSKPPRLARNAAIGFGMSDGIAGRGALQRGWGAVEASFTWSVAPVATVAFVVDPAELPATVTLEALAFLPPSAPTQAVRVFAGGRELAMRTYRAGDLAPWSFTLPASAAKAGGEVALELRIEAPRSPRSAGLSGDTRDLGIALHRVILDAPR